MTKKLPSGADCSIQLRIALFLEVEVKHPKQENEKKTDDGAAKILIHLNELLAQVYLSI